MPWRSVDTAAVLRQKDKTMYILVTHTKPAHLRRAPPTPYGAAEMLLHHVEAIAAAAAAAAAASSSSGSTKQQKKLQQQQEQQQQQQQQQQQHSGGGGGGSSSSSNGSSDGDSTSPAILLPYLPKPRSLAAAVGFAFPLTTQTRRPINAT